MSKAACTLSGYPTILIGITPTGEQESLRPEHGGMFADETAWPANLRPGRSGAVVIATSDACPALNQPSPDPGQPFVGAIIGLPGGGAIRASAEFNAACGVSITTLGELAQPFPQTDVALTVTLRLPTLIRPGRTLHYAVSLMNPTPHPVSLRPCPAYLEGVFPTEGTTHTEVSYYLNCDRFGSLMPGRSITFAMQVPIPNVAGPAKFGWQIPAWGYLGHAQLIRIG